MKNKVFSDYCDVPYENIGFDTPYVESGVLVCFIMKEPNRSCHMITARRQDCLPRGAVDNVVNHYDVHLLS